MILSTKNEFIPAYLDGSKKHSFRTGDRWREGMTIHHFAQVRTVNMHKFMPDRACTGVQSVKMIKPGGQHTFKLYIDGKRITDVDAVATNDGFKSKELFLAFFGMLGSTPARWEGQCIHWTDLRY